MESSFTYLWWSGLCAISALNVLLWGAVARVHLRAATPQRPLDAYRGWQLLLSCGYVVGCAFRSVFPVYDIPRICLFDVTASSVIIGRSVATVAELCFAAQWSLMVSSLSRQAGAPGRLALARSIVPLILIAEMFSWYSVLTTSNLGHVVEETIWGLCATLVVVCLWTIRQRFQGAGRWLIAIVSAAGLTYAAYMFLVDVPMYWTRWLADETYRREYLGIADGIADAWMRRRPTDDWAVWRSELVWMSLYFSVGVWSSIALARGRFELHRPSGAEVRQVSEILNLRTPGCN